MTRTTLVAVAALAVVTTTGAYAADRIFAFKAAAFEDLEVTSPCTAIGSLTKAVSGPNLYDTNPWLTYTCENGRIFLRRYLNPGDNGQIPIPVFTVPDPHQTDAPAPTPTAAPKTVACTVPGMVTSIYGGCVDKYHPNAPRLATR